MTCTTCHDTGLPAAFTIIDGSPRCPRCCWNDAMNQIAHKEAITPALSTARRVVAALNERAGQRPARRMTRWRKVDQVETRDGVL
jgi:hypothetical protein